MKFDQKKYELHKIKFHKRQNERKGQYTLVHFEKKVKLKSKERKNVVEITLKTFKHCTFLGPGSCDFNLIFFSAILSKIRKSVSTLPVILSFRIFFVAQTSITH